MPDFMHKLHDKMHGHFGSGGGSGPPTPAGKPHHEGGTPPFPIDRPDDPLPVIPQPGQKGPGPGQMPPKVADRTYYDRHEFYSPKGHRHNTMRDLGFTGVLDGKIVWSWGDTLMGTEHQANICAVDSTSIGSMHAPMCSMDTALAPHSDNVRNWIPTIQQEEQDGGYSCYSFGGTNIVEVAPNKGIVYYLKMHRPGGVYKCHGAGVGTCEMGPGSVPHAQRPFNTMWNDLEPTWGDVGVCLNAPDGHLYVYGHGPQNDPSKSDLNSHTYLCRVPADKALDMGSYEYWRNDSKTWTRQRFANGQFGTLQCTKEMAIFGWHEMNQSAPFWSNYFNKWMFIYSSGWPTSPVLCKTADRLEGPWEDHGEIATTLPEGHKDEGMRYCVVGHPEFDASGKTVLATWTRNNVIWGVKIEWQ
ncbi:hypothetical protein LTR85_011620 [Meristemomyces frigidus]|nr:hypothetical protein LTR85_011620 [Meristemomyces frigidus]